MQTKRFVNLNKAPTYIQDPKGHTIMVRPFQETLNESARRSDAIYVLEGAFWESYAQGGKAGPLHPFPAPAAYGREALPPVQVHHFDGRENDGRFRTDGSSLDTQVVVPLPGKIRVAGDVLTPAGKIRRKNPETGEDEEVDDTPENRSVLKPLNPPGVQEPTAQLKKSIIDYLEEMRIETVEQFDALTDKQLLTIPGLHPLALPNLRTNIRALMVKQAEDTGKVAKLPARVVRVPPPPASFRTEDNIKRAQGMAQGRGEPCAMIVRYRRGRTQPETKFCRVKSIGTKYTDWDVVYRTDETTADTVSSAKKEKPIKGKSKKS